jgi:hypothetical protein
MNAKNILIAGSAGGAVLLFLLMIFSTLSTIIAPYDIAKLGGMRAMDDPIMIMFFFYPFVLAFAAAGVFDIVQGSLSGAPFNKGVMYGVLLFVLVTIPSMFVMISSMNYPVGFYIVQVLEGAIGYPVLGIIFAKIWKI